MLRANSVLVVRRLGKGQVTIWSGASHIPIARRRVRITRTLVAEGFIAGFTAGSHISDESNAEVLLEKLTRPLEGGVPPHYVLRPSQAKIGEVVHHATKDALAVLRVLRSSVLTNLLNSFL